MILTCACKHPFQDRRYGKGRRVHNEGTKHGPKCTVCGKEKVKYG